MNKIDEYKVRREFFIYLLPVILLLMVYLLLFQYSLIFFVQFVVLLLISAQLRKYKKPTNFGLVCIAVSLAWGIIQFIGKFVLN